MRAQTDAAAGAGERSGAGDGRVVAGGGNLSAEDPCVVGDEQDDCVFGGAGGKGAGLSAGSGAGGGDAAVVKVVRGAGDKDLANALKRELQTTMRRESLLRAGREDGNVVHQFAVAADQAEFVGALGNNV